MATTFKPVVYAHQRRRDGSYNVKIRVTHNRKTRNVATNVTVDESQLTRGLRIKDHQILDALGETVRRLRDAVTALGFVATEMDVDSLLAAIRQELKAGETFALDFVAYGLEHAATRKRGTRMPYEAALAAAVRYCDGRHPDVNEITTRWLRGYIAFLQGEGRAADTVKLYLSKLSKIHALARREFNDDDGRVVRIPGNPFQAVAAPAVPKVTRHKALDVEAVQKVIDLRQEERSNSRRNLARDMWLLSLLMQGMNLADLWQAKEGPAGFVEFVRKKTADSHPTPLVVRIEPEARRILCRYAAAGFLLGRCRSAYTNYTSFYSTVCRGMKDVAAAAGVEASFNAARHTWATLARNICGIDKYTVHEALSHADRITRIDDVYLAPDYSRCWEANRAVAALFDWARL